MRNFHNIVHFILHEWFVVCRYPCSWPRIYPNQRRACSDAMRAAQRHRCLLGGDLEVVFALVYRQNMIVWPAKNVQERLSPRKELPHEFSVKAEFLVARDGRLPRLRG